MADLLPDIPSDVWNSWSADQFAQAAQDKIASLPGDISQGVQSILAPPTPPISQSEEPGPALGSPVLDAGPAPTPSPAPPPSLPPEPAPAPEPQPSSPPLPSPTPGPAPDLSAAPDISSAPPDVSAPLAPPPDASASAPPPPPDTSTPVAPPPTPPAAAPPSQASSSSGWDIGKLLNLADSTGADMGQFTSNLNQQLGSASGNMVGAALGAADAAGANMGQFASQLGDLVPQTVAATPSRAAQSLGIQGPTPQQAGDFVDQARQAATAAGIDPDIFTRQIQQESGFNPSAKSGAGAIGIAQFMPGTAAGMGIDPTDPLASLKAAATMDAQNLQKYGGDWGKALAAYNAGGGNVDKYGGIPPFAETQSYVSNILGGAKNVVQQAADNGVQAVNSVGQAAQGAAARTSQFAMGLSSGDAMAFCGPAAAMAFAQTFGRNPTVDEAKQLAQQVGWNASQGMAGVGSEVALLKNLGIDAHSTSGVNWNQVAQDASSGNPVIIDTPGHYFYVDGYNADTGQYHLGSSATDLKAAKGQEWFTPDQIPGLGMGDPRAAVFADHPLSGPGAAAQQVVGNAASALGSGAQSLLSDTSSALSDTTQKAQDTLSAVISTGMDTVQNQLSSTGASIGAKVQSAIPSDLGQPLQDAYSGLAQANQSNQEYLAQHPDIAALGGLTGQPIDPSKPLGPQLTGFDPYGQIVQQGIPSIISGVQQGNVGDVLGGGLQTLLGAASVLPGGGGPETAATRTIFQDALANPDVQAALRTRQAASTDVNAALGGLPAAFGVGGQPATTGADLLQRALTQLSDYPEEIAAPIREQATAGAAPASDIANMLMRWMLDNPASDYQAAPAVAQAAQAAPVTAADVIQAAQSQASVDGGQALRALQSVPPGELDSALQDVSDAMSGVTKRTVTVGDETGATAAPPSSAPSPAPTSPGGGTPTPPGSTSPGGTGAPPPTPPIPTPTPPGGGGGGGGGGGAPPPGTATPTAPTGNLFSQLGQWIASAASPTENLPPITRNVIQDYAKMVGRNSDAANVIANSDSLRAGGLTPTGIQLIRDGLTDTASSQLATDLQAQGLAAQRFRAPANFRLVTDDPHSPLANWAFDPSVVPSIRAVTDLSRIANNDFGRSLLAATGTAKQTLFSLSNFHTMTEGLNAAFSSPETLSNYAKAFVSNDFAQTARSTMANQFDAAAKAGVTGLTGLQPDVGTTIGSTLWRRVTQGAVGAVGGGAAGYTEAKIGGQSEDEARSQAIKGAIAGGVLGGVPLGGRGTVSEILNSALWERAVPLAKVTAFDGLVRGGMDASEAASVINERFGGLNYAAMGRNPALVDASKLLVQAPDWNESTVRQLGSALFGGSGAGVRRAFLAKAIGGMMATTEAANYALTGHSTRDNQPGHQFEIEMQDPAGGYMHIGVLPGNVQSFLNEGNKLYLDDSAKRGADVTNFATSRMGALPQLAAEAAQTATSGGNALREPYAVSKAGLPGLLESFSPIGIQQVAQGVDQGGQSPLVAALMAITGINPRYQSASSVVRTTGPSSSSGVSRQDTGGGGGGAVSRQGASSGGVSRQGTPSTPAPVSRQR